MSRFGTVLTSTETSNWVLSFGLCAMQYGSRNYIMTILKTQFLGKTLHHVKKRFYQMGFTIVEGGNTSAKTLRFQTPPRDSLRKSRK